MNLLSADQFIIERDDANHPTLSGNKLHKLTPNITAALQQGLTGVLSFGGPFSNHLHALAWACNNAGLQSIGVIRGELQPQLTPTLRDCQDWGMTLVSLSRKDFRQQQDMLGNRGSTCTAADLAPHVIERIVNQGITLKLTGTKPKVGDAPDANWLNSFNLHQLMVLPEGGSNVAAITSLAQAYRPIFRRPEHATLTHAVCATGTGATLAGLRLAAPEPIHVLGIQAVAEGNATMQRIKKWLGPSPSNLSILAGHLGGFGKTSQELTRFIDTFEREHSIPLDPIYNGKVMLQLSRMSDNGFFTPQDRVLVIHTGGLQGKRSDPIQ